MTNTFTKKLALLITTLVISFMALGAANTAHALFGDAKKEACKGANLSGSDDCKSVEAGKSLGNTVSTIINLLSVIIGIAAVIVLIVNGLRFITSSGEANNITAAKNGVIYALVGLVIVALAQVIVRFVINKVAA
jgi:hypothetical protein